MDAYVREPYCLLNYILNVIIQLKPDGDKVLLTAEHEIKQIRHMFIYRAMIMI